LTDRDAHDRAESMETLTNVAWTGAIVFAVVGAGLLVASAVSPSWGSTSSRSPSRWANIGRF